MSHIEKGFLSIASQSSAEAAPAVIENTDLLQKLPTIQRPSLSPNGFRNTSLRPSYVPPVIHEPGLQHGPVNSLQFLPEYPHIEENPSPLENSSSKVNPEDGFLNVAVYLNTPKKLEYYAREYTKWELTNQGKSEYIEYFDGSSFNDTYQRTLDNLREWHRITHIENTPETVENFRKEVENAHIIESIYTDVAPGIRKEIVKELTQDSKRSKFRRMKFLNQTKYSVPDLSEEEQAYIFEQLGMEGEKVKSAIASIAKSTALSVPINSAYDFIALSAGAAAEYKFNIGTITDPKILAAAAGSWGLFWATLALNGHMNKPMLDEFGYTDNGGAAAMNSVVESIAPDSSSKQRKLVTIASMGGDAIREVPIIVAGLKFPTAFAAANFSGAILNLAEALGKKGLIKYPGGIHTVENIVTTGFSPIKKGAEKISRFAKKAWWRVNWGYWEDDELSEEDLQESEFTKKLKGYKMR